LAKPDVTGEHSPAGAMCHQHWETQVGPATRSKSDSENRVATKRNRAAADHQMSITKERKQGLIGDFRRGETDTGSPEIQIAILTTRVGEVTEHLRTHKKDYASRRGLLMMVSRRRRLLDYLKTVDPQRYLDIIRRLDIRK
jgi:small subunit ribosomal protein S15